MSRRILIQVVAVVVVSVFAVGILVTGGDVNPLWLRFFSAAVFAATLAVAAWEHFIWRVPLLSKVPGVPRNVRGTWRGTLESFWIDKVSGTSPAPKTVYLVIRQSASRASVVLLTNESRSKSTIAKLTDDGITASLDYMYLNVPDSRLEERSRIHHGSTSLEVSGRPPYRLRGKYWTNRDSRGQLDFNQRSQHLADDFDAAERLFLQKSPDPPPNEIVEADELA